MMPAHFENGEKCDRQAFRSHGNGTFLPADLKNGAIQIRIKEPVFIRTLRLKFNLLNPRNKNP